MLESIFTTSLVQGQGKEINTRLGHEAFDQVQGVGHLRTPLRVHKGAHDHAFDAGVDHGIQEGDFLLKAHAFAFNLKAIS